MASIKKKKSGGEGGANWMDTYGDMVTLLLCFFVLLYSMSTISEEKWMLIVQSFNKDAEVSTDDRPLGPDGESDQERGDDMPMTQDEVNEKVDMILKYLQDYSAGQSDSDSMTYSVGDGYVFISFNNDVFFAGDSWRLLPAGQEALLGLCPTLDEARLIIDEIVVTGHTATAQVEYNASKDRRLAGDRAAEVAAFLQENSTINPARITDQGKGQWLPVADNVEEEDRRKNRRVEIIISFAEESLDSPVAGSIEEYYTITKQENPDMNTAEPAAE